MCEMRTTKWRTKKSAAATQTVHTDKYSKHKQDAEALAADGATKRAQAGVYTAQSLPAMHLEGAHVQLTKQATRPNRHPQKAHTEEGCRIPTAKWGGGGIGKAAAGRREEMKHVVEEGRRFTHRRPNLLAHCSLRFAVALFVPGHVFPTLLFATGQALRVECTTTRRGVSSKVHLHHPSCSRSEKGPALMWSWDPSWSPLTVHSQVLCGISDRAGWTLRMRPL